MSYDTKILHRFRTSILDWFAANSRPLPWRRDYTPYATWIAEVMMQQTQMDRGIDYFLRWMERFPTIASVANAEEDALLSAWEGLGYYRRVRNLQAAAKYIMTHFHGRFPDTYNDLLTLPGIGPYTAGAIASTAFNLPVPCVDGNVERVLSRVFNITTPIRSEPARSFIRQLATDLIPDGQARNFNQAVMELGALVCSKVPRCSICPLQEICTARALGLTAERPVRNPRKNTTAITAVNGILIKAGKLLLRRRPDNGIWAGLWEFPGGQSLPDETAEQALHRIWLDMGIDIVPGTKLATIKHNYTTFKVTLHAFFLEATSPVPTKNPFALISPDELENFPMPAPHRTLASMLHPDLSPVQEDR